jgi:hypothetical protein
MVRKAISGTATRRGLIGLVNAWHQRPRSSTNDVRLRSHGANNSLHGGGCGRPKKPLEMQELAPSCQKHRVGICSRPSRRQSQSRYNEMNRARQNRVLISDERDSSTIPRTSTQSGQYSSKLSLQNSPVQCGTKRKRLSLAVNKLGRKESGRGITVRALLHGATVQVRFTRRKEGISRATSVYFCMSELCIASRTAKKPSGHKHPRCLHGTRLKKFSTRTLLPQKVRKHQGEGAK